MGKREVSRRIYFGKWHRICPYCGIWFPAEKGSHKSECSVCKNNISYCKRNSLPLPRKEFSPYVDCDIPDIEAELRGEIPVGDLYESCSQEKIKALQNGDVEMLLKIADREEGISNEEV